jgi:NADPH2:quinone reductase
MGATFIDYRAASVDDYVRQHTGGEGFDVVYDTVGGATLDASFRAARQYHGHVVSCLGWGTHALAPLSFRAATYSGVFTLLPLLSGKGRAQPRRDHARSQRAGRRRQVEGDARSDPYTLDALSVGAAHAAIVNGTAMGKLVVDVA